METEGKQVLRPTPIHLLFWLLFHPSAWRDWLAQLELPLPPDFSLVTITPAHWRNVLLRRLLVQSYCLAPLLTGLSTGLVLWLRGAPLGRNIVVPVLFVAAISISLSLIIGTTISVAAGLAGSVTIGLAVGVVGSTLPSETADVAVPAFMALAIGLTGSIAALMAESQPVRLSPVARRRAGLQSQIGGVIIGVLMGVVVVAGVRTTLTSLASLTTGLSEDVAYWLSRTLVVGAAFGLAAGVRYNRRVGLAGGVVMGLMYGLAVTGIQTEFFQATGFLIDSGLAIGLASGVLFGTSFGATVVLPYALSDRIAGAWAGAWAGALGSWSRHIVRNQLPFGPTLLFGLPALALGLTQTWWRPILLYPLTAAWNLMLFQFDSRRPDHAPSLLGWHSAFWDEFQRLPLIGLDNHLLLTVDRHPVQGQAALSYLATGPQRWAAQAVQLELEARRLEGPQSVTALANVYHHLVSGELTGPANTLLHQFAHLSRDIEAALNQTTPYHQRLALSATADRLNSLERELNVSNVAIVPRFQPIAGHWRRLVDQHLHTLAETVAQSHEIDNPYIVGVPLTAQQEIFVGRTDIVARIEQLLLDPRRPPLLLYGQRRMGKTSLLRNLGRLLPQSIVPLFVDGQRVALAGDYPDFLYNLSREMSRSARQQRNLTLPLLSLEALSSHPFTRFNGWLDDIEQTLQAQNYSTALLALDEFEMLEGALAKGRFDETDILSTLRHMIQHRAGFKVMLTGSHTLEEFQRWASYLINVQVLKLGYLSQAEARQLIEQPIKNFPLRYSPQAGQRMLDLTHGHPALVQLLCYELVTFKNEQPLTHRYCVEPDDVEAVISKTLHSGRFFFADIQQNQIDVDGLALLQAIATQGEGAIVSRADLSHHCPPNADLEQVLHQLLQRDLLEAVQQGYRFQVELIRRWIAD